ncbi:HNH endonuclease signature motif containing protein [Caballeronia sp. LZ062]|uniref:HNH endonuclease signature motif containing protein n=1 Tax=unclassified Caballeronia TaxID=2646786 RepID=UPI002866E008|nr:MULTISPECIES: HNH endonuclease signature motif containing protein [unclassified Caballeronia]MDR5856641.1 HNH endonuclease signature motif containing protein [Caballeronia sp. LZ050]MDR5868773.1 HNH endonuclease signature motif containing protein [Caballeronia sp. LZ062]
MARRFWTEQEVDQVKREYPDGNTADIARALARPISQVYQKARALGLGKSVAFLESDRSGRVRRGKQDPRMIATRFQKGQTSWNKGTKGICGTHPNSRRTQFQKGSMSGAAQHNYVPIGSERLSKDGYLERKVTDDHPVPARRWVGVHRLVWEAANGPIPPGHVVCFLPGRRTADAARITLDALELVSRAELAHRNHPRNRDPELAKLVQLKGAITRQVNRIAREAKEKQS